jgi:hypothetical protein
VFSDSQPQGESNLDALSYMEREIIELRKYRQNIENFTLESHKAILKRLGNEFIRVLPIDVNREYLLEVLYFLNALYGCALTNFWECENKINSALTIASVMANIDSRGSRNAEFFENVKPLGKALLLLSNDDCVW